MEAHYWQTVLFSIDALEVISNFTWSWLHYCKQSYIVFETQIIASWWHESVKSFWKCLISFKNPDFKLPKTKLIYSLSCFWTTKWKSLRKSLPPQSAVVPRWCNHFPNIACCWWLGGSPIGRSPLSVAWRHPRSCYYCKQPACSPPTLCAEPTTPSSPLFMQRKHRRDKAQRSSAQSCGSNPKAKLNVSPKMKAPHLFRKIIAALLVLGDMFVDHQDLHATGDGSRLLHE